MKKRRKADIAAVDTVIVSKRGRPPFVVTDELAERVERYVSCRMSQQDIARVIGCSVDTLVKHFADNIENAVARRKAQAIDLMFENAIKGNAASQKRLYEKIEAVSAEDEFDEPAPRQDRLGKKEQAARDAQTAGTGTEWGDDLNPDAAKSAMN